VRDDRSRELNRSTWEAYSSAYEKRYRTAPVRNAMVNGQVSQLGKRLGSEAPQVAVFYVTHRDKFYERNRHPVSLLLKDAEKLRTEWATGEVETGRRQTHSEANAELATELWRRNEEGKL
jgi:hypothetical protein